MPESGTYGSVRGALGNHRSYRYRRASLEKDDAQADPNAITGKADTAGGNERSSSPGRCAGVVATACIRWEARATREAPRCDAGMINRKPVRDRPGALGWRRGPRYR
jgi:hypothetical protein